jgi:arylsulfate sulfotransferase
VSRPVLLAVAFAPVTSFGVTILSGPTFTKAGTNAPLAGTLALTTDEPSRVSASWTDGTNTWTRSFYNYKTSHAIPLFGFKPGRTNAITVTVHDKDRNEMTAGQPVTFDTSPLPTNFPNITLLHGEPDRMEPGYTLFRPGVRNDTYWYGVIVDNTGDVVWYGAIPSTADVRQLPNGNLFMPWKTNFIELDLLGNVVRNWIPPGNLPVNLHDGVPTDHNTILYLSNTNRVLTNYPSSMTVSNPPTGTAVVRYEKIVEISTTNASTVLNIWSPFNVLDPWRTTYLISYFAGWDSEHCNGVIEDPRDNSLIISMRHQNAVVKIDRDTGELKWILGPHNGWKAPWEPYLLTPEGEEFQWQFAQHNPVLTPHGTLLMFDNGNYRASPFEPIVSATNYYSRAVEYEIDEENMVVRQVWDYGRTNMPERIYVDHEGGVEWQPKTGNVLVDFAAVNYVNGVAPSTNGPNNWMIRIQEVTHDTVPDVVFDLAVSMYAKTNTTFKDTYAYRANRIPDLYSTQAKAVEDLSVTYDTVEPLLQFSADPTRTYVIEASEDLQVWQNIGDATSLGDGLFEFTDANAASYPARYYRVVTE